MEEKYGEVEEMNVCDNLGDHLVGNVYVKVGDASKCVHERGGAHTSEIIKMWHGHVSCFIFQY